MFRALSPPPPSPESVAAFAALYRRDFAFVWRSLRRLGIDERELADAAQEVFLVVFKKLPELDLESRLTTWLYAVCLRVASDWRRRAHRRHELVGAEAAPALVSAGEEAGHLSDLRSLLWQALETMPLEQRAVFVAFELEGMTGDEIASALAAPLPTIHSRLRLAREKFRAVIERERNDQQTSGKKSEAGHD
jgi:RNA polymerase sigma-70 factor (ECF subfamily)